MTYIFLDVTSRYINKVWQKQSIYANRASQDKPTALWISTEKMFLHTLLLPSTDKHTKAGGSVSVRQPFVGCSETYSSWGSPCGLGGRVGSSVVHEVSPRTAADYLTPRQTHAHSSGAAASSVVGHAMSCHHSGHLWRAALRVKVAPSTVLVVQLRLWVRVGSSVQRRDQQKVSVMKVL